MKLAAQVLVVIGLAALAPTLAFAGDVGGSGDHGGGHGGGGDIRPLHPIAQADLDTMIKREQWEVTLFFNQLEQDWKKPNHGSCPNDLCRRLFDGSPTIFDQLKKVTVEYRDSQPCHDPKDGTEHDGSAPGPTPDSICLSPFRMAPKLDRWAARSQSLALFAHEVSHLIGTTEDEANAIQDEAVASFYQRREEEVRNRVVLGQGFIQATIIEIQDQLALTDAQLTSRLQSRQSPPYPIWENVTTAFMPEFDLEKDFPLPILPWSDIALLDEAEWRAKYAFMNSSDDGYNKVFNGQTVLPYGEYRERLLKGTPAAETYGLPLRKDAPVYWVHDGASLRQELQGLMAIDQLFVDRLKSYGVSQ